MRKRDLKFSLDFISDNFGIVNIEEPIGYYDVDLSLEQKETGKGRDVSFSGGDYQFKFSSKRDHYFEKILYYFNLFGFESKVDLIISEQGYDDIRLELDFATAETDEIFYFKCSAIQKSALQILKRRKDIKVDLFSNKDLNGDYIEPLKPENLFLSSKPITASSKWELADAFYLKWLETADADIIINPFETLTKGDIKNSLIPINNIGNYSFKGNEDNYIILQSEYKKDNLVLKIENLSLNIKYERPPISNYHTFINLIIAKGQTYGTSSKDLIWSGVLSNTTTSISLENENITYNKITSLLPSEKLWLFFETTKYRNQVSNSISITKGSVTIEADETYFPSVVPSFRLIDVIKHIVKSSSGLKVNAPRFEFEGEFYDNFLFNGNTLRNAKKDGKNLPFYVSLEDIEKSLNEVNGGYEIDSDGKVFFGTYEDFYTSEEVWFFDSLQFSGFKKSFNPKHSINQFSLKYKKYLSQKEKEAKGSSDVIHGESSWTLHNKMVENKKETTIEWIRDAFHLRLQQDKAFEISEDTATQDDDELFCIDSIPNNEQINVLGVTKLNHQFDSSKNEMNLTNNGEFNFNVLGIFPDETFKILNTNNAGTYKVISVTETTIRLQNISSGASTNNNNIYDTNYEYSISPINCKFKNYTNEGITNINGLASGDRYSNLRYSLKRNIINYYQSFLATCNLYWKEKALIKSVIKNNADFEFTYNGITTKEGDDFIPKNPILSPYLLEDMVFANVEHFEFNEIQKLIRSKRGYIRTIDNTGKVIKFYAKSIKYSIGKESLMIIGEEKYDPLQMTINTNNPNYLLINNETRISRIEYEFEDDKLIIFDAQRQRLYNPVYWFNVMVNNFAPKTQKELEDLLKLI